MTKKYKTRAYSQGPRTVKKPHHACKPDEIRKLFIGVGWVGKRRAGRLPSGMISLAPGESLIMVRK